MSEEEDPKLDGASPNAFSAAEEEAIRAAMAPPASTSAASEPPAAMEAESGGDDGRSPNEWGDDVDAAIRAAMASSGGGGGGERSGDDADEDKDDDNDKSPNEWGAAEERAIHAAMAAADADDSAEESSKTPAEATGGGNWEAAAAESLLLEENSNIEMLEEEEEDEEPLEPLSEPCPPLPRVQYVLETLTTESQRETEDEVSPFFVDLKTLPNDQLMHLRAVGLLSPEPVPATGKAASILGGAEEETGSDGGLKAETPDSSASIRLLRNRHAAYLSRALTQPLSRGFVALDASRPWIVYWTLHSLDLLDALPYEEVLRSVVNTLDNCWQEIEVELDVEEVREDPILARYAEDDASADSKAKVKVPAGGFSGGPGQMAHCAPSYAAVLALCIVHGAGTEYETQSQSSVMALNLLQSKRERLYAWYLSLRQPFPSLSVPKSEASSKPPMVGYRMHHDGEVDVRATYTMLAATELLNITTVNIARGASDYVAACQTYEGGFGGEPHSEAHGGYTFCALVALRLLRRHDAYADAADSDSGGGTGGRFDAEALGGWLSRRQMSFEGGFQGRANKLVDGCYSFWQGGGTAVLDLCNDDRYADDPHASGIKMEEEGESGGDDVEEGEDRLSFDRDMLQRYILLCAQDVNGGLRDKPSKPRDFYHSCYNLSGLSVAQNVLAPGGRAVVWGDTERNRIGRTHPVFNVRVERVQAALREFGGARSATTKSSEVGGAEEEGKAER